MCRAATWHRNRSVSIGERNESVDSMGWPEPDFLGGLHRRLRRFRMLISDSGARPNRVALFADIESMESSSGQLKEANAVFRNDQAELARLAEHKRRYKTLRLVEVFEAPKGRRSRYWSVELDGDQKTCRLLDAREFRRDATFKDIPGSRLQPLSSLSWGDKEPTSSPLIRALGEQERAKTAGKDPTGADRKRPDRAYLAGLSTRPQRHRQWISRPPLEIRLDRWFQTPGQ